MMVGGIWPLLEFANVVCNMVYCDDVEISQNDVLQSPSIVVIIEDECLGIYNISSVYTILFVYVCVIFLYVCGCLCVV